MFDKILVANRGEIALRIMRAARELGLKTVAVYSTADSNSLPVRYADEAVCIGPPQATKSYLSVSNIIAAAKNTGAQAIHPGYGFLAESADFAQACKDQGIVFIGPSAKCISLMGDKSTARSIMRECGVPTVPGSGGCISTPDEALSQAEVVGYPVLIKASAGGGGKGMREVYNAEEMESNFLEACIEAAAAFGDGSVYLEKLIDRPRHIEVQVLADNHGNRLSLCERDCSIQRRHQKLIEEAPSSALTDDLRRAMSVAALKAVRAVDYRSVGTVEFLLSRDGHFYFMEMNTRLQVEHPVTEQIIGVDIVKEQIRIAAGLPISCAKKAPFVPLGHAIEFRINAEDPDNGFLPCPGVVSRFDPPLGPGVRVESHVQAGETISPYYDSLLAKLIVYGQDREEAMARARRAIDEFVIEGVKTTLPFHRVVLANPEFIAGQADTSFLDSQNI